MGKKLTSWEKATRERELERERRRRADAVEKKRVEYRETKQSELKEKIESSKESVEAWEKLYENIINLPKRIYELLKQRSDLFENLGKNIPNKVPDYTRKIEIIPIENIYDIKLFKFPNNINNLKLESKLTIEEYAKKYNKIYISWLDFIFKTKKSYENHISINEAELEKEIAQYEKKKAEFINLLTEYEKLIVLENQEFKLKVDNDEKVIKEGYESFSLELGKIIEHKKTYLKLIKKEFSNFEKPVFYQVLLSLLPIDFDLQPKKYLRKNPSKLKVGISKVTQSEASIYIQIDQESFPIDDIQLVMLKERHSEKPLTNFQIKEVEQNYYSGLLLSYAYYMFKYTELENLQVRIVKNMPDPATGKNILNLEQGIKVSKSEFEKINISKIIPFEALKKISNLSYMPTEEVIFWTGRSYSNFYSIEKDVLDALLSGDKIDFPEDFKGHKKIKTPMSDELQTLSHKLSKYIISKKDVEYSSKNVKNKEDELEKQIASSGSRNAVDAYRVWKSDSEKLLLATRKMLANAGLDTSETDELLKKYHNH